MKKVLFVLLLLPVFAHAQFIYTGPIVDSTTFTFSTSDSFMHFSHDFGIDTSTITFDSAAAVLWQIGNTLKPVFSNTVTATHGIMTDTLLPYPANANSFFVLTIYYPINCTVDLWHKYQTDSLHAGGIVEFSTDSATWINIASCPGIGTQNFYTSADTIISAQPAFTGNSNGERLSRFQLVNCIGEKSTTTICFPNSEYSFHPIYIRFRFVSDSTVDSLSGWIIDSIRIDYTGCPGAVKKIVVENIVDIFPNPAYNELNITSTTPITQITITNLLGQTLYTNNYNTEKAQVDVADLPTGVYLVKINGTEVRKFVKE